MLWMEQNAALYNTYKATAGHDRATAGGKVPHHLGCFPNRHLTAGHDRGESELESQN